jgi:hypothetical protein
MADFVAKLRFEAALSAAAGIVAVGRLTGAGVDALKPTLATQF